MNENPIRVRDCKVCLMPHNDEIHAATLNVRQWFGDQVTKNFVPDFVEAEPETEVVTAA